MITKSKIFKIKYKNKTYPIPKTEANFTDGYAVIKVLIKSSVKTSQGRIIEKIYIKGIIDEKYKTIVEFSPSNLVIDLFPKGNFIIKKGFCGKVGSPLYRKNTFNHYTIKNDILLNNSNFKARYYETINDTLIKVVDAENKYIFERLYDVIKGTYITPKFLKIGEFKNATDNNETKVAEAIYNVPLNNTQLEFYIFENGKIYNPYEDIIITSLLEFNDFIKNVKQNNHDQEKLLSIVLPIKKDNQT